MKTILVVITTHKRNLWCLELLKQIKEQSNGFNIKVAVFHDKDETDYSNVVEFCKDNKYIYFESKENFGKWRYYEMLNFTYAYADSVNFDYFISIPDDCILVEDFFNRAISLPTESHPLINFFTMNIHANIYNTKPIVKLGEVEAWQSNWVDGSFIATKKYMSNLRIQQPYASKIQKYNRGSGIAHELIREYQSRAQNQVLQTVYALVEHIGNIDTVMHDARRRKQLYGDDKSQKISSHLTEADRIFTHSKLSNYGIS